MALKTNVGQIYLTHPKDENFTSIYEEAFTKHGVAVELFLVLEIASNGANSVKLKKPEYEKLVQTVVGALKKTYVTAPAINEDTFERALAAINAALSRLASRGKVNWYGKFHAAAAALWQNQFALSTTGNALVYLSRRGEITSLSEDFPEKPKGAIKIFSNYSSGKLAAGDRVILSTNQIFNYLSLERLREFLGEESLEEACEEIITTLQDIKTAGFSTFIFETYAPGRTLPQQAEKPATIDDQPEIPAYAVPRQPKSEFGKILTIAKDVAVSLLKFLWITILKIVDVTLGIIARIFGTRRSKKFLGIVIALALLVLLVNVGLTAFKRSGNEKDSKEAQAFTQIEEKLNEAEAALIYDDQNKAVTLITDAEDLLAKLKTKNTDKRDSLRERLLAVKNRVNKEERIENPTVITTFPNIPTDLIRSGNGILGFNRDSGTMAFYDFRTGEIKPILKNKNTSDLVNGVYAGGKLGYVFLKRSGRFAALDLASDSLTDLATATSTPTIDLDASEVRDLEILGEGTLARLYILDPKQNQIWRIRASGETLVPAEKWLKTTDTSFAEADNFSVDGSIFVQYKNSVQKFFNGQRADFELAQTVPSVDNVENIFTQADYQYLYLLEPDRERIMIFAKDGKLHKQLVSPKFRELSDIYADEKNKIIHVLSGSELLQINY